MTRKHFEALAEALRFVDVLDGASQDVRSVVHAEYVNAVADVCKRFNPNFQRDKFLAAAATAPRLYGAR